MSLFDLMDKFGKMADELQKNGNLAETMQQLPARLQAWTEFQAQMAANLREIVERLDRIEAQNTRILALVTPAGDLPEEVRAEMEQVAHLDPRNLTTFERSVIGAIAPKLE